MEIFEFIETIKTREDFIYFLNLLNDYYREEGDQWENGSLEMYLHTLPTYAEDVEGYYKNTGQSIDADVPSWRVFADILMGATMYE